MDENIRTVISNVLEDLETGLSVKVIDTIPVADISSSAGANLVYDYKLGWISPSQIDWCIVGGESGTKARPMNPDWARSVRDQCINAGVSLKIAGAYHCFCPGYLLFIVWVEHLASHFQKKLSQVKKGKAQWKDGIFHNCGVQLLAM